MKTSGIHVCSLSYYFSLVSYYTFTIISLLIMLKLSKLLKIMRTVVPSCIRESFVTDALLVSRRVKSQKFKTLCFQNERRYQAGNF